MNLGAYRLRGWLGAEDMQSQDFVKALDIAPETLSRWLNGKAAPSKVAKLAIEYLTDKYVEVVEWEKPSP